MWDLLHAVRAPGAAGAEPRWDPVYELLEAVSAAAEWGLPSEGPAAALLRLEDPSGWEPARCAPRSRRTVLGQDSMDRSLPSPQRLGARPVRTIKEFRLFI